MRKSFKPWKETVHVSNEDINLAYKAMLAPWVEEDSVMQNPKLSECCPVWQGMHRHYGEKMRNLEVTSIYTHSEYEHDPSRMEGQLSLEETGQLLTLTHDDAVSAFVCIFDHTVGYLKEYALNIHGDSTPPSKCSAYDVDGEHPHGAVEDTEEHDEYWATIEDLLKNSINPNTQRLEGTFTFEVSVQIEDQCMEEFLPELHGSLSSFHRVVY